MHNHNDEDLLASSAAEGAAQQQSDARAMQPAHNGRYMGILLLLQLLQSRRAQPAASPPPGHPTHSPPTRLCGPALHLPLESLQGTWLQQTTPPSAGEARRKRGKDPDRQRVYHPRPKHKQGIKLEGIAEEMAAPSTHGGTRARVQPHAGQPATTQSALQQHNQPHLQAECQLVAVEACPALHGRKGAPHASGQPRQPANRLALRSNLLSNLRTSRWAGGVG